MELTNCTRHAGSEEVSTVMRSIDVMASEEVGMMGKEAAI